MIKLIDLLKEEYNGNDYVLPPDHKAFMRSEQGFSCAMCKYYSLQEGKHHCGSKEFELWNGSPFMNIDDPTKWCSDWFEPTA